ncbi:hypothetical protein [Enterococcus sp. LJL51]|uniref:hypothetical protein n=1 Tax=Enterococcus sp. LJL51 TaxID=3416656 RepID=UPI003CEC379D
MKNELLKKIKEEIEKSGYPTELRTNKKFQSKYWQTTENSYYIDQDENKGREIDLEAHKSKSSKNSDKITVWSKLSVEIKKSEKPWVIFTSNKKRFDTGGYGLLNHKHNINRELLSYEDIMKEHPSSSFKRLGRSEFIPFTKGSPQIFDSLLSSVKSCIEVHRSDSDHKEAASENSFDIIFYSPLIVVDSRLFESHLEDDGEITIDETEHIVYSFNYASPNYQSKQYLVDVVTLSGLENYLEKQNSWIDSMFNILNTKIRSKNLNK